MTGIIWTQASADVLNVNAELFVSEESKATSEVNLVDAVLDELDAEFEWEDLI